MDYSESIEINDIKNKEKRFEIISNKDKLFNLCIINQGNSFVINAFYNDEFKKFIYEKNFNLSDIQKVKLFTLYSSIDECLEEIFEGIDTGKSSLFEEINSIILTIPLMNKKYNKIMFKIDEKEKNDNEKYQELYQFFIDVKKENSLYKKEINELKNEIKNMKLLLENLNQKFQTIEEENKNFKLMMKEIEKEKKEKEKWIESNIVTDLNDKMQLKNWISEKKIESKLLYKLSLNGETIQKFHELCDNIKNNLIIIQTQNNNNIFGSYCTWCWDKSGNDLSDNEGFIFSLNKKEKYINEKTRVHQGCTNHGPYIYDYFYFNNTMKKCIVKSNIFFNSTGTFDVKEVEIYQIIF